MKLVIAEKPSVGAAIAAVIGANEKRSGYFEGSGYLVSWCIGHLIIKDRFLIIMSLNIPAFFAEDGFIPFQNLNNTPILLRLIEL